MAEARAQRFCPTCYEWVLSTQQRPNHVLHLLLTVLLCGVWGVVWVIVALTSGSNPWLCARCGSRTRTKSPDDLARRKQHRTRQIEAGTQAARGDAGAIRPRMSFCEHCAGEVQWIATRCPHCGKRLPKRR